MNKEEYRQSLKDKGIYIEEIFEDIWKMSQDLATFQNPPVEEVLGNLNREIRSFLNKEGEPFTKIHFDNPVIDKIKEIEASQDE